MGKQSGQYDQNAEPKIFKENIESVIVIPNLCSIY